MQVARAGRKEDTSSRKPTETFTGDVLMDPIFSASDCLANNVCFSPGARTFWHTHERGQVLTVTMGTGLICSKGQAPRKLQVGDVVHIPGGEMHWHGGTSTTMMAHQAISIGKTSWYEELDQKEYEEAQKVAT